MVVIGRDYEHTAISQTVGLPAAMGVKLIAQEKITGRGVLAPITPDIYVPILNELAEYGIQFVEKIEKK
jgi:saccharopine dehydrogenase-like NADP-dependent oxidoreductase